MLKKLLACVALALALAPAAVARTTPFIPGVTDFPTGQRHVTFIAGSTDFPSPAVGPAQASPAVSSGSSASGFNWSDAGIGASVAMAAALTLAGLSAGLRRRGRIAASS
jgi:hypothetical protein